MAVAVGVALLLLARMAHQRLAVMAAMEPPQPLAAHLSRTLAAVVVEFITLLRLLELAVQAAVALAVMEFPARLARLARLTLAAVVGVGVRPLLQAIRAAAQAAQVL